MRSLPVTRATKLAILEQNLPLWSTHPSHLQLPQIFSKHLQSRNWLEKTLTWILVFLQSLSSILTTCGTQVNQVEIQISPCFKPSTLRLCVTLFYPVMTTKQVQIQKRPLSWQKMKWKLFVSFNTAVRALQPRLKKIHHMPSPLNSLATLWSHPRRREWFISQ